MLVISETTDGEINIELLTLLPLKHMGDVLDLSMYLVTVWETLTKNILKTLAVTAGPLSECFGI